MPSVLQHTPSRWFYLAALLIACRVLTAGRSLDAVAPDVTPPLYPFPDPRGATP
jgi:hypothetical protein